MAVTQACSFGPHAGRRYGSFAGKAVGGAHPVGVITQATAFGAHSARRYGSFAGKGGASAAHPVGRLTQAYSFGAHSGRRYGSFAGKGGAGTTLRPLTQAYAFGAHSGRRYLGFAGKAVSTPPAVDETSGGLLHAIYAHRKRQQDVEQARKRLAVLDDRRLEVSTDLAQQRAMAGGRRTHSLARAEKAAARRSHSIQLEQARLLALIREEHADDDAIALLLLALA